jgi:nucleotide-binding universal stress UspA family protein
MATTLLVVAESEAEIPDTTAVREALRRRSIERVDHAGDPTQSLVTESMLGFDLVVSGTASRGRPAPGTLVGPVATAALMRSALPVLLVRPPTGLAEQMSDSTAAVRIRPLRRILRTTWRSYERTVGSFADPAGDPVGERLIDGIEREAAAEGVDTQRLMVAHGVRGEAIVAAARDGVCDLVILGAQVQDAAGEPYIGQTAETVLVEAPMTVAVVAFPPA